MRVKLLSRWGSCLPHRIYDIADGVANVLVRTGRAVSAEPGQQQGEMNAKQRGGKRA